MLDIKNIPIDKINQNRKQNANFVRMKNQMDVKMASYLRYLGTKNAINRASDYHYLVLAVTDSTAPVNGIDYIHPSVKPAVDYATAVITKGLVPNGEINFEFVPDSEEDDDGEEEGEYCLANAEAGGELGENGMFFYFKINVKWTQNQLLL